MVGVVSAAIHEACKGKRRSRGMTMCGEEGKLGSHKDGDTQERPRGMPASMACNPLYRVKGALEEAQSAAVGA